MYTSSLTCCVVGRLCGVQPMEMIWLGSQLCKAVHDAAVHDGINQAVLSFC